MRNIPFIYIFILLFAACAELPVAKYQPTEIRKIMVADGPEDMVLDISTENPRLLVSCLNRRIKTDTVGGIFSVDIDSRKVIELKRTGEPVDFKLRPHGIDLFMSESDLLLYVVSHEKKDEKIVVYKVIGDTIQYVKHFSDKLIKAPNDVAVTANGFYVSNDNWFTGNVIYCSNEGNCKKVLSPLKYANGVGVRNNKLYISVTMGKKIIECNMNNEVIESKKTVSVIKGGDNFSFSGDTLLVTSHPQFLALWAHYKNRENPSPSVVYFINPVEKTEYPVFVEEGYLISAASTAVYYNNRLYLCQIFDGFIIECELKQKD
jgi:hypothetical protein